MHKLCTHIHMCAPHVLSYIMYTSTRYIPLNILLFICLCFSFCCCRPRVVLVVVTSWGHTHTLYLFFCGGKYYKTANAIAKCGTERPRRGAHETSVCVVGLYTIMAIDDDAIVFSVCGGLPMKCLNPSAQHADNVRAPPQIVSVSACLLLSVTDTSVCMVHFCIDHGAFTHALCVIWNVNSLGTDARGQCEWMITTVNAGVETYHWVKGYAYCASYDGAPKLVTKMIVTLPYCVVLATF